MLLVHLSFSNKLQMCVCGMPANSKPPSFFLQLEGGEGATLAASTTIQGNFCLQCLGCNSSSGRPRCVCVRALVC